MATKNNSVPLKLIDKIIVRSPLYPFNFSSSTEAVLKLLEDDFFMEAIYIASPLLYDEAVKLKEGKLKSDKDSQKIINSLYRYFTRMYSRSTPFGLFSTCDVAEWGSGNNSEVNRVFRRHTRLDMYFLQTMVSVLIQITNIKELLHYHTNSSIYFTEAEIRYIEHTYLGGLKKYKISAVTRNNYVTSMLAAAKDGVSKADLVKLMLDAGISAQDAGDFIDNLIDSQLLLNEFEVATTGEDDFAYQILNHLQNITARSDSWYVRSVLNFFKGIVHDLQALDTGKPNRILAYKQLIAKLKQLQPVIEEGKTFHIDSYRTGNQPLTVRESAKEELLEAVTYMLQLNQGMLLLNKNLEDFKAKFWERYEGASVPLVDVLDTDTGIAYPINRKSASAPMVDDIHVKRTELGTSIQLSAVEKWLFELLSNDENRHQYSVNLDKYTLTPVLNTNMRNAGLYFKLPLSMSVLFRVLNNEQQTLLYEGMTGPSAAAFLARFTYGNKEIREVVETVIAAEEAVVDNAILAEFVHLPDNRVTNVIMHPPLRKFEIPYLAKPSSGDVSVIELADLYLRIENNEFVLFSKKMNKRILPRKTHMHTHTANSLPIYHFLGDLQEQEANRNFILYSRELMRLFVFVPRLYYKSTILSPAMWALPQTIIEGLKVKEGIIPNEAIEKLRVQYKIPNIVLHVEGDNELLVDFTNTASVQIWLNLIKHAQTVVLKEFLYQPDSTGKLFTNQYIASLVCTEKKHFPNPLQVVMQAAIQPVQRHFPLGSEWLFLKLYCGIGSVDVILGKAIAPVMDKLMQQGLIQKWFFIKYFDPEYHIRLRMLLNNKADMHQVLAIVNESIEQSQEKMLVWKIQPDTYKRELERYGPNTMEPCESIFFIDSMVSVKLFPALQYSQSNNLTFLWAIKMTDDLLNAFQLTIAEKLTFTDAMRKGYQLEFNADKDTNDRINAKYNALKNDMQAILGNDDPDGENKVRYMLLQQKIAMQTAIINEILAIKSKGELQVEFDMLVSSLIHMMLNRLISVKERMHEFLVYEFLVKYYRMLTFKGKNTE
jgi:thiopeptide-type bacteriocin biosynthesis protein